MSVQSMIRQDLVEIARAVVRINDLESEARSADAEHLLSQTASRAREVLAMLEEGDDEEDD